MVPMEFIRALNICWGLSESPCPGVNNTSVALRVTKPEKAITHSEGLRWADIPTLGLEYRGHGEFRLWVEKEKISF